MATIQTRLTSDNKQHDEAFKKSKQQVYNYNKQVDKSKASVLKFAKGGLGALGAALGVAGGAMDAFNTAIKTNQQLSDKWGIAMEKAKSSYQHLISSVSSADFSHLISGFRDVSAAAEKAYKAMDAVATQKILSKGSLAEYNAKLTEAKYNFKIGKGSSDDVKYWEGKIEEEMNKMLPLLQEEMEAKIDKYIGWNTAKSGAIPYGYAGIIEWANKGEQAISKEINNLQRQLDNTNKMTQGWLWQQLDNKIRVLKAVEKKLTDGEMLDDVMGSIESYWNYNNSIYQQKLSDTKYTNTSSKSNTESTKPTNEDPDDWKNREATNEYLWKMLLGGQWGITTEWKDEIIKINEEVEESEIDAAKIISDAEKKKQEAAEKTAHIFSLQIDALNSLSSAFSTLGNAFDNEELNIASIVLGAIANIAKAYSEASAKQAEGSITGWDWLAFSVAGLAQVAGVIAQIHSLTGYANGGIIGGNSYTGDKVLARVNSGEMILNPSQQANLFNMINGGISTGGEVKFRIEGSTLVGVLNNYNKKTGRVL